MPPRFAYWTIILDGAPTSFRTKERDEILPLFNQLKAKNPGALLKWFSGGRLWDSPEQAKELRGVEKVRRFRDDRAQQMKAERESGEDPLAEFRRLRGRPADGRDDPSILRQAQDRPEQSRGATRDAGDGSLRASQPPPPPGEGRPPSDPLAEFRRQHGRPADGSDQRPPAPSAWAPDSADPRPPRAPRREGRPPGSPERRNRDWRPGGEHKDPRDKYKLPPGEARKRWKDRNLGPRGPKPFGSKPGGDRPPGDRPYGDRPQGDRPFGDRPRGPKPFGSKPGGDRPWGGKPRGPGGGRPFGDRPRGPKPFGSKPGGDRPWGGKPSGPGGGRPFGDRPRGPKPFGSKPGGDRPRGGKPSGPGGGRPFGDRPRGPKPFGSKPGGDRSPRAGKPRGPGKPPGGPRRKG